MKSCNCCTTYSAPDLMDGGVAAALVEQEVAGSYTRTDEEGTDTRTREHLPAEEERTPTYWRGVVREYKGALEKAEQERDDWKRRAGTSAATSSRLSSELVDARARAEKAERERDEAVKSRDALANAHKHQAATIGQLMREADRPRPLTADDLSDEAIRRARVAWLENAQGEGCPSAPTIRAMFAAALTEPTRPEGAEEIEEKVATAAREAGVLLDVYDVRKFADSLAAQHVGLTGAES